MSTASLHLMEKLTTSLYVPQNTKILKRSRDIDPKWVKRKKVTKLVFCNFLYKTNMFQKTFTRSTRFLFSDIHFKWWKRGTVFVFCGTFTQIFGAKKGIVSVSYIIVFWFLICSYWRVLRLYLWRLLRFVMPPTIAGERSQRNLDISIPKLWIFLWWIEKNHPFPKRY